MIGPEKQIVALRRKLRLSQEAFAKEIGFSQSYVTDIETGRTKPSRRFLEAVNSRFGISIDKILVGLGEKVLNVKNYISGHGFIYLFDFKDKNLDMATEEVLQALLDFHSVMIDASNKSINQVLSVLTGKKGGPQKLWNDFGASLREGYKIFIIKNISLSKISRKGYFLLDFYHKIKSSGSLIVIDKSGLLEKNCDILSDFAYPIYIGNYTEDFILLDRSLVQSV